MTFETILDSGPAISEMYETLGSDRIAGAHSKGATLADQLIVHMDEIPTGAPGDLINEERRQEIERLAAGSSAELNLRRIGWIFDAREQMLEFNVQPALALESMMLALKLPDGARR